MDTKYYISTGDKQCFYTLRTQFTDFIYCEGNTETVTRDYFVRNLSTDKNTAIEKAKEILGKDLTIDFDLNKISRGNDIDWSIFHAGKYEGKSILEILESDKDYILWVCENLKTSQSYAKTIELVEAYVKNELASRKSEKELMIANLEKDRLERIEKFKALAQQLDDGLNNSFCNNIANELRNGNEISPKAMNIVSDIIAKMYGRRNSQKYNEKYEEVQNLFYGDKDR